MRKTIFAGVVAATLALGAVASAVVTFDAETGKGFVGKGDVQLVFDWNNKQLQENAKSIDFRANSASETTWTCTKVVVTGNGQENEIVQERERTTTTQGLVTTLARENSKGKDGPVTGFNLDGYEGSPTQTTEGPAVGSCPSNPSGFEYDNNAQTTTSGGGLEVTKDGSSWYPIGNSA